MGLLAAVFLITSSMEQVTGLACALAALMEEAQPGDLHSRGGQHVLGTSISPTPASALLGVAVLAHSHDTFSLIFHLHRQKS